MTTPLRRLAAALRSPASVMGVGRLGVAVLGLAATPILTRTLTAAEYGTFALFIAVVSIASTVPVQWLTSSILRFGGTVTPVVLRHAIVRGTMFSAGGVVLIAVVGAAFTLPRTPAYFMWAAVYALLEAFYNVVWMSKRAQLAAWTFTLAGVVRNGVPLTAFLILVGLDSLTLDGVLASMAIASALGVTSMWRLGRNSLARADESNSADLRSWFIFGRPLIANYALALALTHTNRFVLLALVGVEAVGRFAPTYDLIVAAVTLLTALTGLVAVPRIFASTDDTERTSLLHRLHVRVVATVLLVALALALAWPQLSEVLIGDELRIQSTGVVLMLATSASLMAYRFQYLNIRLQLLMATTVQTTATFVAVVVNIALGVLLIPHFEITGAAVSTLAASALANVWISVWLWRSSKKATAVNAA